MRPIAVCVAAACVVGLAAPAALASSGGSGAQISLSPSRVRPGNTVGIQVDCSAYNNPRPTNISSQAFSTNVILHQVPGALGHYSAAATIDTSVRPGDYAVAGACETNGEQTSGFQAVLSVVGPDDHPTTRPDHHDRGPITGPVHTGVGGSSYGTSPAQVAVGASLVVSAGALALWRRRRPSGEGSGDRS
jgi:hypothetical protein